MWLDKYALIDCTSIDDQSFSVLDHCRSSIDCCRSIADYERSNTDNHRSIFDLRQPIVNTYKSYNTMTIDTYVSSVWCKLSLNKFYAINWQWSTSWLDPFVIR